MSKYTTELRFICEQYAGEKESVGYDKVDSIIVKSRSKLFDFDYPIFDVKYKNLLETKIIRHFYTREIGTETVGLFKFMLQTKMNEIMPLYNQYYQSELIKFNPMNDFDYSVTSNRKGNENRKTNRTETANVNSNSDTNTTDTNWNYYHDTPQGSISTINDETYLTNARKVTDNNDVGFSGETNESRKSDDSETIVSLDDYLEHRSGKQGTLSYSQMLKEFRETFLNIDIMVIGELEELFMQVW